MIINHFIQIKSFNNKVNFIKLKNNYYYKNHLLFQSLKLIIINTQINYYYIIIYHNSNCIAKMIRY